MKIRKFYIDQNLQNFLNHHFYKFLFKKLRFFNSSVVPWNYEKSLQNNRDFPKVNPKRGSKSSKGRLT